MPTATDPRPGFFWSAETPRDFVPQTYQEFPRLMWHQETAQEITVHDRDEAMLRAKDGYGAVPPHAVVVDPMDSIKDALLDLATGIRMVALYQSAIGGLDLHRRGLGRHPQDGVMVHGASEDLGGASWGQGSARAAPIMAPPPWATTKKAPLTGGQRE
jgi:hypothetical protein